MSQITTHVLDTSLGKPAIGVKIFLYFFEAGQWKMLSSGYTNIDGRIDDLTEKDKSLKEGTYKLKFETKIYFDNQHVPTFYPYIEIIFQINADEHHHVPVLLNPFGFSTYRGS